jgi:hypothetical protein
VNFCSRSSAPWISSRSFVASPSERWWIPWPRNSQPGLEHRFGEARVDVEHARVDARADRQIALAKELQQARHAGAIAVFRPAEVRQVRDMRAAVRRNDDRARRGLVERPVLDVDDEMDDQRLAVRRPVLRLLARQRKVDARVRALRLAHRPS